MISREESLPSGYTLGVTESQIGRFREEARRDPEGFWSRAAAALPWQRKWDRVFEATPITAAMTKNPITIAPDASVREVVTILYTKRVSALPVVDGDQLVGIVTISDMLGLLNQLLADGESGASASS